VTYRKAPVHILTDLAEEDFRLDTIPHVGSGDRDAIFARRLAQIYRSSSFRYARLQGREPDGRRDDRVLYSAITNPDVLRPWLDAIERLSIPLAGIHSSAIFSGAALEELDLAFENTLLVTLTPGQALRQTYFRGREFRFSRLTPIDLEEGQSMGAMIAEETTRTWQYLDSLRNFVAEDRLEVCLLLHPRDRAAIEPLLRGFDQIQYRVLETDQVAAKLGLQPAPLDSTAEEILVHLFLLSPGQNHYALPELRRHATLRNARFALNGAAALVLLAGLGWGGYNLWRVIQGNTVDDRVGAELLAHNREYDEITRGLPSLGVGGSAMRDAVMFYNASIKSFPALKDFVGPLSTVLQGHPQVRLSQLGWYATDDPKASPNLVIAQPRNQPPVRAIGKSTEPAAGTPLDEGPNPPFTTGRYEVAMLEGTVLADANDFRGAVERVEGLANEISKLKGYKAQVLESPLDLRPALALQGRLGGEREPGTMELRFLLRIVRERNAP
jgi:hypothetical protein